MDRKNFIRQTSVGLLLGIPATLLIGCSSSDDGEANSTDDGSSMANCLQNGTETSISANHGHNLTVSRADVDAAQEKTYTLSQANTDQHIHEVTISASQFNSLKSNNQISVTSTSQSGHNHSVTVSCA